VPYYFGADDQPEKIALGTFRRNVPDISQGKREERGFSMHITGRLGEPSLDARRFREMAGLASAFADAAKT
jgi:hypothetical protein